VKISLVLFLSILLFAPPEISAGSHVSRLSFASTRVPGLPIRDCAGSSNNRAQMWPKLKAIDVTEKTFFQRMCLVPGLSPFEPRVNCPYAPTPPPFTQQLFLDFRADFFRTWPLIFLVSTNRQVIWPSPGTLTPTRPSFLLFNTLFTYAR